MLDFMDRLLRFLVILLFLFLVLVESFSLWGLLTIPVFFLIFDPAPFRHLLAILRGTRDRPPSPRRGRGRR